MAVPGLEEYELVAVYRYVDEHGKCSTNAHAFTPPVLTDAVEDFGSDGLRTRTGPPAKNFYPEVRRVPYRLPELIAGVAADDIIFLCEGEKDVDAVRTRGLVATTTFAQPRTWNDDEAGFFAGARVVVLPDNDEQGCVYAQLLEAVLHSVAGSIAVLELPGLGAGEDVYDWLEKARPAMTFFLLLEGSSRPARWERRSLD